MPFPLRSASKEARLLVSGCLVMAICVSNAAHAQVGGTILHATVADAASGNFLLDAQVTVSPIGLNGLTDFFGDARFVGLPKGAQTVRARRLGYEPLEAKVLLSGRDSLEVVLLLHPISPELATVRIEGLVSPYLTEFEQRRRQGKGYFITESELRAAFGTSLESIVASKIPGITIRARPGSPEATVFSTRGLNSIKKGSCPVTVYWNGVRVGTDPTIVPLEFVGGIEFYNPGYIPVQYLDPGNDCGVFLLWPRN